MLRLVLPSRSVLGRCLLTGIAVLSLSLLTLFTCGFARTGYALSQYQAAATSVLRLTGSIFPNTPVTQPRWSGMFGSRIMPSSGVSSGLSPLDEVARDALANAPWVAMPIACGSRVTWLPLAPALYFGASLAGVAGYRWLIRTRREQMLAVGRGRDWQPLPPFMTHWVISLVFAVPVLALPSVLAGFWLYYDDNVALCRLWPVRIATGGLHLAAVVWCIAAMEAARLPAGGAFSTSQKLGGTHCSRCGYGDGRQQPCPECGYPSEANAPRRHQRWRSPSMLAGLFVLFATTPLWVAWLVALSGFG